MISIIFVVSWNNYPGCVHITFEEDIFKERCDRIQVEFYLAATTQVALHAMEKKTKRQCYRKKPICDIIHGAVQLHPQ